MSIDINAFRLIANQSPDKFVYAQGDTLKASHSDTSHDAHTYRAATNAFLKACVDHYGSQMGSAIVRFLQDDIEGGKPLTARKIKALVEFADEKMGSATKVDVGGKEVELEKIGTDSMSRVGFSRESKIAKAKAGQQTSSAATLAAFKFGADGKVDLNAMLRHLFTFRAYIDREIDAHAVPKPSDVKRFEKWMFTAVDAMDNNELSAVYQGLISKQTDTFKKELVRIINHPDAKASVRTLAEQAFADISRIEAMVVSEISRRMILDRTPDAEKAGVPSLMQRYVGENANPANHYAGERDMSTVNLAIVASKAGKGSNLSKTADAKTDAMFKSHGMGAVDSKKIGDMLRAQELTINMKFTTLMGYSRTGAKRPSLFKRPDAHLVNTFESKELQGRDVLGTDELRYRNVVEKCFFPEYGTKPLQGRDRPVYGALNTPKLTSGGADTVLETYGKVVVVLRPHVKQNCTYSLDDSFLSVRVSFPAEKRAEMEEALVAAFASRLEDPAAVLAELRDPESDIHQRLDTFYTRYGAGSANLGAKKLDQIVNQVTKFLNKHLKVVEVKADEAKKDNAKIGENDVETYFLEHHALKKETQSLVAGYDNIENLLAQESDFTALSMGVATLRSQENPKSPCDFTGHTYIEAQFHGPVILDRDVEEIRIDLAEMTNYFLEEFDKLPAEDKAALNKREWVEAQGREAIAEIRKDTKNAPFKVTFYNSQETFNTESTRLISAREVQEKEAIGHLKDDLVALGQAFMGDRFGEIREQVINSMSENPKGYRHIKTIVGEDLSRIPDWIMEAAKAQMSKLIEKFGTDTSIYSEEQVHKFLANRLFKFLCILDDSMAHMDEVGFTDPGKREALLKEIVRMEVPNPTEAKIYIDLHLAGEKALADLSAYVKESFEKDIEDGKELFKWAFNGLPPVSGVAERTLRQRIQDELLEIKTAIAQETLSALENDSESLIKRLRKNTVKPFMEPRARIMVAQTHMQFRDEADRAAFLGWATSAGRLRSTAEFDGVYGGSSKLVDAFEAKIKTGAPLTAQDLVDAFKAFIGTAVEYMIKDAQGRDEYGPDDRAKFIERITSVALSRLALRVGKDGLAKIAAALDTADARWLHAALQTGDADDPVEIENRRGGSVEMANAFITTLHQRLTEKFDLPTHPTDPPASVTYGIVPPAVRALVAQLNPIQAQELEERYPYDPATSGARRLANIPAPVNPAALPQNKAGRKQFLLKMLPIYHNHEKTFDYGTNTHGRTHATRAFVFSVTMGNILKEKGVTVDMNAVALATAGHDTGRRKNGRETADSEKRSAETVVAAVNETYPGAAGPAWTEQVKINITAKSAEQDTIEGYLFKSADSLDYSRVDGLDEKRFPFLKEPIATPEGFVLPSDKGLRRQLMKEAKLLSELTDPNAESYETIKRFQRQILELDKRNAPQNEIETVQNLQAQVENEVREREKAQTDNLTDQQIVDLVENAIRSRPQDFPFLTKYYLNAE